MEEHELLLQRFLDQDLTPEERVAFLQAIDANPVLRRSWLNLEMVSAEAAQLPRIAPSAKLIGRLKTMRVPPAPPSVWERVRTFITVSRTLEWNLVGGTVVLCAAAAAAVTVFINLWPERMVEVPVANAPARTIAVGTEQAPTVFVRVVLLQPMAQSVSIAGDFNGWNPTQNRLERSDGGVWTVTLPLKPGRYQYMFVIDGKQWIPDPLATEEATDGFGSQNAVLDVAI